MADRQDERTGRTAGTGSAGTGGGREARAARVAAMQREERARARRRTLLVVAVPTALVLGIAAAVTAVIVRQPDPPSLEAVSTFTYSNAEQHTEEPQDYAESPPVGGPHHPVWQNCGVYEEPVPDEHAVHSLEHGAVWITYRPDLPAEQVEQLREAVSGRPYTLLSPREDLPSPVVLSAWNNQLTLDSADDPRLNAFLARFVQGAQTPEPGALCTNGVGTPAA
ncbi:DUF3105 domain-containing protein [Kineococcus terrestris]|uniref:DUF3105 domain-containing protein n=1 Tax=Kineococcus terrestris TaxID=2044856 RepID=UPI0034DB0785